MLFIDTNILLDMYGMTGPDLDELRQLVKLVEDGKVGLLLTQQVVDEFWRRREGVIADAMKRFGESRVRPTIPNLIRSYPESTDLKEAVARVNSIVKDLSDKANLDTASNSLKADEIILQLFEAAEIAPVAEGIVAASRLRADIGNPPGKRGSLGDAINWEWLLSLELEPATSELIILSADADFASELEGEKLREFLRVEWFARHPKCALRLERSLAKWLQRDFPEIKLTDEAEKDVAIEKLEDAWDFAATRTRLQDVAPEVEPDAIERLEDAYSFAATHKAIHDLSRLEDFTDAEIQRLLNAYLANEQINWILGDADVRAFALKLVELAKSEEALALAQEVRSQLAQFEDEYGSEDEIPF